MRAWARGSSFHRARSSRAAAGEMPVSWAMSAARGDELPVDLPVPVLPSRPDQGRALRRVDDRGGIRRRAVGGLDVLVVVIVQQRRRGRRGGGQRPLGGR
ncbi:hypothetical protein GCM10018953_71600 [Streptosporangium nondiastaticum]